MDINSFTLTQGFCVLSEEIHEAKLSLVVIIGQCRKRNQGQGEDYDTTDFRMVLKVNQMVVKFLYLYFGYERRQAN